MKGKPVHNDTSANRIPLHFIKQTQGREDFVKCVRLEDPVDMLSLIKFSPNLKSFYNYVHYTNAENEMSKLKTIFC